jgi:hypothetical protein
VRACVSEQRLWSRQSGPAKERLPMHTMKLEESEHGRCAKRVRKQEGKHVGEARWRCQTDRMGANNHCQQAIFMSLQARDARGGAVTRV